MSNPEQTGDNVPLGPTASSDPDVPMFVPKLTGVKPVVRTRYSGLDTPLDTKVKKLGDDGLKNYGNDFHHTVHVVRRRNKLKTALDRAVVPVSVKVIGEALGL